MIRQLIAASAACFAFHAATVTAQEVKYDQIEEKNLESGKKVLQADKAYIFITGAFRTNGIFLKTPDADDLAEYEAEWKEELAEAQRKHPSRVRRYERELGIWQKTRRGKKPEKPEEPTEENFSIGDIERRMIVSFGPQYVYGKGQDEAGDKTFSYLVEVEPGTYSYYGPLFYAPNVAPLGTCYCMGTVKFEAAAGKVTSLGDFLSFGWVTDEAARASSVSYDPEFVRDPKPVDYTVPDRLAEFGAEPADLRAQGKLNNIFGVMIGRMPAMEGVLAYDRDTPIDVKGLADADTEVEVEADAELNVDAATDADAVALESAEVDEALEEAAEAVVD